MRACIFVYDLNMLRYSLYKSSLPYSCPTFKDTALTAVASIMSHGMCAWNFFYTCPVITYFM